MKAKPTRSSIRIRRSTAARNEPELQLGGSRSVQRDEHLKRAVRQHPRRDGPRIDAVDGSLPAVEGSESAAEESETAAAAREERHGMIEEAAAGAPEVESEGAAEPEEDLQTGEQGSRERVAEPEDLQTGEQRSRGGQP